jgi:hypothetical protein
MAVSADASRLVQQPASRRPSIGGMTASDPVLTRIRSAANSVVPTMTRPRPARRPSPLTTQTPMSS